MNKTEIHSLIEETIRPNNKKAIGAQALANVLSEMVTAMGEGGAGVLRVWVPIEDDFTEEQLAENVAAYNKIVNGGATICSVVISMTDEEGYHEEIAYPATTLYACAPDGTKIVMLELKEVFQEGDEIVLDQLQALLFEDGNVELDM